MKRSKYLLILILSLILLPISVNASSMRINLSCKNADVKEKGTCTITGTVSGTTVTSVSTKVSVSGSASFVSFSPASGWSGDGNNGIITLYTDVDKKGTFNIGTLTYKANKSGSATIKVEGGAFSEGAEGDFNESSFSGVSKNITIKEVTTKTTTKKKTTTTTLPKTTTTTTTTTSTTTTSTTSTTTVMIDPNAPLVLDSIAVSTFEVTEENGIYYSTVTPETNEVNITATASPGISIYGIGKRYLAEGKNLVEIILVNTQNKQATYKLIITKPNQSGEYDTTLSKLNVTGYKLSFQPKKTEYTVSIPYNIDEVYVEAVGTDDVIINGDGVVPISKNGNDVYVKVSYGNLASTTYVLHLKKNYSSMIMAIVIGGLSLGLIVSIYISYINKKSAVNKVIGEKNKVLAEVKKNEKYASDANSVSFNGQNVVGIGSKPVVPSNVIENQPKKVVVSTSVNQNNDNINTNVAPQVKIIRKTVIPTPVNPSTLKPDESENNVNS